MESSARNPKPGEALAAPEASLRDFLKVAVERGYCTVEQVEELLRQTGTDISTQDLATLLIQKGTLTQQQAWAAERAARGTTMIGGFEILEKVGQGGMGAVFRARQVSMDRIVAIKILPPKLARDPSFKTRFLQEARTSAKLTHLNIIGGIDCGEVGGYTFFAMEYVDGQTVRQMLKARGRLAVSDAVSIMIQMAQALVYAKQQNLVHRDVKPDNIMVTSAGVAKLCDLGLAKKTETAEEGHMTQKGLAVGTPHYISPEQARGDKDVDFHSDIYSLGATFYHMLTGRTVFEGPSSAVVMAMHLTQETRNPCDLDPGLPLGYGQIIAKMMAKEAKDRYKSPEALMQDLEAVKNGGIPKGAVNFKAKTSCLPPSVHARGVRMRTTGPAAPITGRQTTAIRTPPTSHTKAVGAATRMKLLCVGGLALAALLLFVALRDGDPKPKEVAEPTITPTPLQPVEIAPVPPKEPETAPALIMPEAKQPPKQPLKPEPPKPVAKPEPPKPPVGPASVPVKPEPPKPQEMLPPKLVLTADVLYTRFLHELLERSAKHELSKIQGEMAELAKQPEFAPARADINAELADLKAAIAFEAEALKKMGAQVGSEIEPHGSAVKKYGSKGKILGFEPGRGIRADFGAEVTLNAMELPLKEVLRHADANPLGRLQYLAARGVLDQARSCLPRVPDKERKRCERKLALLNSDETELTAKLAYDNVAKVASAKSWKTFEHCVADFEKTYGSTAVAKQHAAQIAQWKATALEALTPPSAKVFHAASCKEVGDGFFEVVYDFSNAEQMQDFTCPQGTLAVADGRLNIPPVSSEVGFARYNIPFAQLRSVQVIGRNPRQRPTAIAFGTMQTERAGAEPSLILQHKTAPKLQNQGAGEAPSMPDLNYSQDTEVSVEASGNELKWSINGKPVGTGKVANMDHRMLILSALGGEHSWKRVRLVFKPVPEALKPPTPAPPPPQPPKK